MSIIFVVSLPYITGYAFKYTCIQISPQMVVVNGLVDLRPTGAAAPGSNGRRATYYFRAKFQS